MQVLIVCDLVFAIVVLLLSPIELGGTSLLFRSPSHRCLWEFWGHMLCSQNIGSKNLIWYSPVTWTLFPSSELNFNSYVSLEEFLLFNFTSSIVANSSLNSPKHNRITQHLIRLFPKETRKRIYNTEKIWLWLFLKSTLSSQKKVSQAMFPLRFCPASLL